ncbi:unnamed protein product, partial [Polarella glacialis]
ISSFNPHKGWGFITCEEAQKIYGSDVFLLKNDLNSFGVSKGDQVSFSVTQGDKGARAANVKVLTVGPDGLQSFFGELKSFNPSKGFGFISSPASESIFGKDCFVLSSEFGDHYPEQGMHVQFKAKMGERGPVASDIRVLDGPGFGGGKGFGGKGGMGMMQWGGKGFGGKGFGGDFGGGFGGGGFGGGFGGKGGFGGGKGGFGGGGFDGGFGGKGGWGAAEPKQDDLYFGLLKNVNEERGFGHIACDAMQKMYGRDMFAHKTSIEEARVGTGQSVSFNISSGPKGPHAVNIKPFDSQSASMTFVGQVKTWNDLKGWGFIDSPAARPIFQSDIFLHKNELGGKTVAVGDQVQFQVDTVGGRASAKNVR